MRDEVSKTSGGNLHQRLPPSTCWDPLNFTSRFIIRELPEGLIERLYRFAKARGASVNDLFIAAIAQSTGELTAKERLGNSRKPLHFKRCKVGIGTIVDIRDAASQPLDKVFNLYLSSYYDPCSIIRKSVRWMS